MNTRTQKSLCHCGNTIHKTLLTTDTTEDQIEQNSKSLRMRVNFNGVGYSKTTFYVTVIKNFERSHEMEKDFSNHDEAAEYYNSIVIG